MSTQSRISMMRMLISEQTVSNNIQQKLKFMEQKTLQVSPEQLAQQKAYKESKEAFRTAIKDLVIDQKLQKINRHPDNKGGTSHIPMAQSKHHINRIDLRHLYLAYAIVRVLHGGYTKLPWTGGPLVSLQAICTDLANGKTKQEGINSDYLKKLIEKYGPKTIRVNP